MAAPAYTHDLIDWIADNDTTAWGELVNAIAGGAPDEVDTESALQGTNTVSQITNATTLCSMCRIMGAPVTLSSGQVFLVWHGHGVATALVNYASGGLRLAVAGSTLTDWKAWSVGGVDVPPYPYGKWVNNPIDPTVTADYTNGTPPTGATNIYGVGSMCLLSLPVARGQPHVVDIIRYGRAEARFSGGDLANGYATFAGFAALNDATSARWGLIQKTDGGYLWKGLMTLGYNNGADFRDSNQNIFIQDTRKVTSTFNKIEVRQGLGATRVDWTGINFTCLSPATTASKGSFEMLEQADVNIDSCTFTDMNTFIFLASATVVGSTFRRCAGITSGGAIFSGCTIASSTSAVSVTTSSYTDIEDFTGCSFISDGSNHAMDLGTVSATASVSWANYLTGYTAASTGNEALKVNVASGQTLTINVTSGYDTPSVYNIGLGTVSVVTGTRTVKVAVTSIGGPVSGANVFLAAAAGGPFPYNVSVSINNTTPGGTTARVTHSTHGLSTGDQVIISGASEPLNNGVFTIAKVDNNTYDYTMSNDPAGAAGGTPTSTFVFLKGLATAGTDSNEISMSRSIPSNQPITGWARKTSVAPNYTPPNYKQGAINGTVSSTGDTTFSPVLILDD